MGEKKKKPKTLVFKSWNRRFSNYSPRENEVESGHTDVTPTETTEPTECWKGMKKVTITDSGSDT